MTVRMVMGLSGNKQVLDMKDGLTCCQ